MRRQVLEEAEQTQLCYTWDCNDDDKADLLGEVSSSLGGPKTDAFFLLDSGCRPESAIPEEMASRLKLQIHADPVTVRTANGPASSAGFVLLYVKLDVRGYNGGFKIGRLKCYVVKDIPFVLIGLKDIARFNLNNALEVIGKRLLAAEETGEKEEGLACFPVAMDEMLAKPSEQLEVHPDKDIEIILKKHANIFADTLRPGLLNGFTPIDLVLQDPTAPMPRSLQAKTRTQPQAWESEISKQLRAYVEQGIIETCSSTFWSQILMVKKPDGKLRMCVDYRFINKLLRHEGWPLPNIQELIRKLKGNLFFGKVDMTQGYHQLAIGEGQHLTAFRANGQTYRFKKCPFGLQSAPPYFAYQMATRILNGLESICLIYLDDCIIFGKTREEYLANMETVLGRFEERGILIKRSKCEFGLNKIAFLGHVISGETVELSMGRKQALSEMVLPRSVGQLQSFLGCSNYFRQFIAGYAEMARDLHQLAAKSPTKLLSWTPALTSSWERVKAAVVEAPTLKFLTDKPADEIILYTDASDFAFGGHLVQRQNGIEESILFYSKSFNSVQARWSVSDKEMFSIVHGVLANHYMLMGRKFTIRSDHKALMYNERVSASSKIERWKVSLSEYDISWEFIEGSKNVVADAMSRVVDAQKFGADTRDDDKEELMVLVLNDLNTLTVGRTDDEELLVTTIEWQEALIKLHHAPAHFNDHDTLKSLKKAGYQWNNMEKQVAALCATCQLCQMLKTRHHVSHNAPFTIKSERPGEHISMDVMEYEEDFFGYSFILVLVDCCHSYTTLIPLKTIRAGEIHNVLIQYFCEDGIPDTLRYDQGASLNAEVVKSLLGFLNINSIVTAARSSQENGIAEQKISRVREVVSLLIEEQAADATEVEWSLLVPFAQRALNIMSGSTGFSPAEVRFGLHNRLDRCKELIVPKDRSESQVGPMEILKNKVLKGKAKKAAIEGSIFKPNEKVIIKNPIHLKRNAAHKPYLGPFRVVKQDATSVTVVLESDSKVIKSVKTSEVFRFKEAPVEAKVLGQVMGLKTVPNVPISKSI